MVASAVFEAQETDELLAQTQHVNSKIPYTTWYQRGVWQQHRSAIFVALATFVYALASASPFGYYLDSGEFVAQAFTLGISHPPGQALFGLYGRICLLLFPGPYAFRLALGQALASACAAAMVQNSMREVAAAVAPATSERERATHEMLTAAFSLLIALSPAWMLQSQRPEVYALTNLFVQCGWYFALRSLRAPEEQTVRDATAAWIWMGLAATVHHLIALVAIIPVAFALLYACRYRKNGLARMQLVLQAAGLFVVGLLPFLYLPMRAARASLALGHPSTFGNFFWTISAKAFQHTHALQETPNSDRALAIVVALHEQIHLFGLGAALLGIWWTLRQPSTRAFGIFLALASLPSVAVRALLGFVQGNPDALGYLMPAVAALGMLAAASVFVAGNTLTAAASGRWRLPNQTKPVWAFALLMLALLHGLLRRAEVDFSRLRTPAELVHWRLEELPPHAIVFAHSATTIFMLWGGLAEQHRRAHESDTVVVPVPLLGYPELATDLIRATPELRPSLLATLQHGEPDAPSLEKLATERPTYVELDPRVQPELYGSLVPSGLLYRVVDGGVTAEDIRRGNIERTRIWALLLSDLSVDFWEPETKRQLAWICYNDALYYIERGWVEEAKTTVARGLTLAPEDEIFQSMRAALETIPVARVPHLDSSMFRVQVSQ